MARVVKLKPAPKTEDIVKVYNQQLFLKLIPSGYPKRELSKGNDEAFNLPINLESYQIEKLINQ